MIYLALSLRQGASLLKWRECMRAEIASRFELLPGRCSAEADQYKHSLLRLFVGHGAATPTRRALLLLFPTGDWRASKVQFHMGSSDPATWQAQRIIDAVTDGIMIALCQAQPRLYARHRWLGADLATDDVGIAEGCHRLMSTTFCRFCASMETSVVKRNRLLQFAEACREYIGHGHVVAETVVGGQVSWWRRPTRRCRWECARWSARSRWR